LNYKEIFKDTDSGIPIMVKFAVFGKGLKVDVKQRYDRFLYDQNEDKQSLKTQTALVCSLLDIANIQIDRQLFERMNLYDYAAYLENSILYRFFWL
jgi:hypothetical protein